METAREIYGRFALRALPRLLSLEDRNPLSPTYGCFHRDYWLYKTSDFPDAVRQFSVHALALAYTHDFSTTSQLPTPYSLYKNPKIRDWAIAGLKFWASIQHADGSFDEFYPYERGWVGPTAFTTYASGEALQLLRPEMRTEDILSVARAIRRAAHFIAAGDLEEDHLANHHAMAFLAVSTAADVLSEERLRHSATALWSTFLRYQNDSEGWCLEYDGADPGYLSATVSFLAKVYTRHPTPELREVLRRAVTFCSYFVYPDGSYAGALGSRHTVHFYPHGFELLSREFPLAASIAERMAQSLADGNLVPPEIMSDRYVHYRVPEFLLAARDAQKRPALLPHLPYERSPFVTFFPEAKIAAAVHGSGYTTANLGKGGVIRSYNRVTDRVLLNDGGWVGELEDGRIVTSQWMDPTHNVTVHLEGDNVFEVPPAPVVSGAGVEPPSGQGVERERDERGDESPRSPARWAGQAAVARDTGAKGGTVRWRVRGHLQVVPSTKLFTLSTGLLFRLALLLLGWHTRSSHWLKGKIRKTLILGNRPVPCTFERTIELSEHRVTVTDTLANPGRLRFRRLLLGGEIPVRYVPQSRFFQPHELQTHPQLISQENIESLNAGQTTRIVRTIPL